MMCHRFHLFGGSGSGTSTLGSRLSERIGGKFLDTDSYYWLDTDPPFTSKRDPAERVAMIERDIRGVRSWVLAGSICSWGDPLLHHFTHAVFLYLDPARRMSRLREREQRRYGDRIAPGGDMHEAHVQFIDWACSYDHATAPIRSLDLHERWMQRLECPVIRLNAARPAEELCDQILERAVASRRPEA